MLSTIKNKFQNFSDLERFLIKAAVLFIGYYLFRLVMNTVLNDAVYESFKNLLFTIHIGGASWLLDITGYDFEVERHVMRITGTVGVRIMKACLGTKMMAIFGAFIIIYNGKVINKLWFITLGVIYIIFINIFRIYGLVLISFYSTVNIDFWHTYIFKPLVYIFVFLLWMIWIRKYSKGSS